MEEQILNEILQELKGMRVEQEGTREEMKGMRTGQEATRQEMKGMRAEQEATHQEMKGMRAEQAGMREEMKGLGKGQGETNQRLDSLERTTNSRFESLEKAVGGLQASVQVLTQGFSDVRYELVEIKKLLGTRVIWNNDSVSLQVKEGETLYGVIRKEDKRE